MTEKTNSQLTLDVSTLIYNTANISADLTMTSISRVGLKDASGSNGDVFILDSSLYLKMNDVWHFILCPSIVL